MSEQVTLPLDRMVKYPFPLRSDKCCQFEVPRNLTVEEVERIYKFLTALAKVKEGSIPGARTDPASV